MLWSLCKVFIFRSRWNKMYAKLPALWTHNFNGFEWICWKGSHKVTLLLTSTDFPPPHTVYCTSYPCLIPTPPLQLCSRFLLSLYGSNRITHRRWKIKISKVERANITPSLGGWGFLFYWTVPPEYFKVGIHGEQRELSSVIEISNKVEMEEKRPAASAGSCRQVYMGHLLYYSEQEAWKKTGRTHGGKFIDTRQ